MGIFKYTKKLRILQWTVIYPASQFYLHFIILVLLQSFPFPFLFPSILHLIFWWILKEIADDSRLPSESFIMHIKKVTNLFYVQ